METVQKPHSKHLRTISMLLLVFYLAAAHAVTNFEPDHLTDEHSALLRSKRRVEEVSSSAIEYMKNLRDRLSDKEGKPTFSNSDDPTEVWAIQDRDLLHDGYREKPKPTERCTTMNRFVFTWKSLSESQQDKILPVEKAILRAYLEVIPRHLNSNHNPMPVNANIYMKLQASNENLGVHAGELLLLVTPQSAGWVELNITKGVRTLWPPKTNDSPVEITVVFRTNCQVSRKVPVVLKDPTSISLKKMKRRQRLQALQPLFLIYLQDEILREKINNETILSDEEFDDPNRDVATMENETATAEGRRKRQASSACHLEDFEIVFHDLNLNYVLVPARYNARQCSGSCSHHTFSSNRYLANNHGKIMASAKLLSQLKPSMFGDAPKGPCCVPTKFSALSLLVPAEDMSLRFVTYMHMVAKGCHCR